jgi:transcriptional regulator with PAS, ATPase and Fis domain
MNAHVGGFEGIIGESRPMQKVFDLIEKVAGYDIDVLLTGESGTGKDLVAKTIHNASHRSEGPYVPVNTGALARDLIASELFGYEKGAFTGASSRKHGKFETANGGTLFLDEISTMDDATQISLLRVLENKQFQRVGGETFISTDARIIAATNCNLRKAVKKGEFRNDLFHRFNVLQIKLPPLRKRGDDVILLAKYFLQQHAREFGRDVQGFSDEVLTVLRRYAWPGNVRELENLVLKLVITSDTQIIGVDLLPDILKHARRRKTRVVLDVGSTTIEEAEKQVIFKTLEQVQGNKKKAANILGISRKALYNKLREYKN